MQLQIWYPRDPACRISARAIKIARLADEYDYVKLEGAFYFTVQLLALADLNPVASVVPTSSLSALFLKTLVKSNKQAATLRQTDQSRKFLLHCMKST